MKTTTEDKIAVTTVEIAVAGTKLKLTLEQARQLKKALEDAFPEKETVYLPSYIYSHPVVSYPSVVHQGSWSGGSITCSGNGYDTTTRLSINS